MGACASSLERSHLDWTMSGQLKCRYHRHAVGTILDVRMMTTWIVFYALGLLCTAPTDSI